MIRAPRGNARGLFYWWGLGRCVREVAGGCIAWRGCVIRISVGIRCENVCSAFEPPAEPGQTVMIHAGNSAYG